MQRAENEEHGGATYSVKGEKYKLPDVEKLKPMSQTFITGIIDQWPAHSSSRMHATSQIALRHDGLMVLSEEKTKLPNLVPKPKFLEYLENHIKSQLNMLRMSEVRPSESRLQVYREAFEWLIETFNTYKPILGEIKREYELNLAHLREEVRRLEPLKELVWTISQECDQRVLKLQEQEKGDMKSLRQKNKELQQSISDLQTDLETSQFQMKVLQDALSQEHQRYRNEADARRLLIGDINEMRQQLEDMSLVKKQVDSAEESPDNPVVMRIAYEQAKKAQADAIRRLNEIEADYCEVVPKKLHNELQTKMENLSSQLTDRNAAYEDLEQKHADLKEQFNQLQQQRDHYYLKFMEMNRSATPRPNWSKCSEYVYGGLDRWRSLSNEKSSDQLLDVLLQEMRGIGTMGIEGSTLEPRGFADTVPVFLHHDKPVTNRFMTKRDCRIHIYNLWSERKLQLDLQAEKGTVPPSIDQFIDQFFRQTYGIDQIRLEWVYSFYEALQRFASDDRISTFRQIVDKEADEDVYWNEMRYIHRLLMQLNTADPAKRNLISKPDFRAALTVFLPGKDAVEVIEPLVDLAETELGTKQEELMEYNKLFMNDDEGEYGPFIAEFHNLFVADKMKYIEEIQNELNDLGVNKVDVDDVRRAISLVDPQIDSGQLDAYLLWAFSCPTPEKLSEAKSIELATLMDRLKKGSLVRKGPRL